MTHKLAGIVTATIISSVLFAAAAFADDSRFEQKRCQENQIAELAMEKRADAKPMRIEPRKTTAQAASGQNRIEMALLRTVNLFPYIAVK